MNGNTEQPSITPLPNDRETKAGSATWAYDSSPDGGHASRAQRIQRLTVGRAGRTHLRHLEAIEAELRFS